MSGEVWKIEKDLCRCCHSEGSFDDLDFFPSSQDGEDVMCNMLRNDLGITITPIEGDLSTQTYKICEICKLRLLDATNFKRQVILCEERFKDMYSRELIQGLTSTIEVKIEPADEFFMPEDINMDTTGADSSPDISEEEFKVENNEEEDDSDKGGTLRQLLEKKGGGKLRELLEIDVPAAPAKSKAKPKPKPKSKPKATKAKAKTKKVSTKESVEEAPPSTEETEKADKPEREKTAEKPSAKFSLNKKDYRKIGHTYQCSQCKKVYNELYKLRIHVMGDHYDIYKFACTLCHKTFKTMNSLTGHKLEEHNVDHRFKCNACEAAFNSKPQLLNHMESFHMLGEKVKCNLCDYKGLRKNMRKHSLVHASDKKHKCKYCKKKFIRKTTLAFHERIHTGDKRKVCEVCGEAFVQKASLNYHMMKHHPEVPF